MTSLMEYAEKNGKKSGPQCWLCGIKEHQEVDDAIRSGVPYPVILRWLKEKKGYAEATLSRVKGHSYNHVAR